MPEVTLSRDLTLAYDERGGAGTRPLVLIHGVSMSRRYFHRQVTGASDLKERIPHAEVVLFRDSGHCPFLEESEKFNATVDEFMARLDSAVT